MEDIKKDETARRAELDILAHPVRIRILKMLRKNSMSFSELNKALGIESSGHLQYHLERLGDLGEMLMEVCGER